DALGWRRMLGTRATVQPPNARLSRGLEVHPHGGGTEMEIWVKRSYVPAGYGWRFPAVDALRLGVRSSDPHYPATDPPARPAHAAGVTRCGATTCSAPPTPGSSTCC